MAHRQTPTTSSTNSSSNRSVFYCPHDPELTWDLQHTTLPTTLAVILLIASPITTVLNALILVAISHRKELQKHSNIVLGSMAIADLLVGAIAMPMIAAADLLIVHDVSLEHVCTLDAVSLDLMLCFFFSSLYHLTVVAWERYVAIRKWMDYRTVVTASHLKKMVIIAWLAALISVLPFAIMKRIAVDSKFIDVWFIIVFAGGILAFVAIVYFYVLVYLGVRKRRISEISQVTALVQAKLESKVAKTTSLINGALTLTFVFAGVLTSLGVIFPVFRKNSAFRIPDILMQLNSVINPVIYCYRDRRFKNAFLELLRIRKPPAIQPNAGAVAFRKRKDQFNGFTDNVQLKPQGEVKRSRLTRSASCDPPLEGSEEMMFRRSMSAPALVKDRSVFDGLPLDQPTSVVITSALVNAERKEAYQGRNTNAKSSFEELFCEEHPEGVARRRQTSKSLDIVATERFASGCKNIDKNFVERPKTAPSFSAYAIDLDESSTACGTTSKL